ncbi:MAG: DUF697 domain-containing protein [Shewanella oncorhynchi]
MTNTGKKMDEMWDYVTSHDINLKILMAGKSGVGKGAIAKALIGKDLSKIATTTNTCSQDNTEFLWKSDFGDLRIMNVPSFGVVDVPCINDALLSLAKDAHLLIMVIKCDDKALEYEENFMRDWYADSFLSTIPVIVVLNQIDKMNPVDDWSPKSLNLGKPSTPKEIIICNSLDYIAKLPSFSELAHAGKIIPTSAGKFFGDTEIYGIDALKKCINDEIPDALRLIFSREEESREVRSDNIIQRYSLLAGAAALQPIPFVDSMFIAPIQIMMMMRLGRVYDVEVTKSVAGGVVSSIGLSLIGSFLFLTFASVFPGIKQVIGPAIAYGLTYSTGLIVRELFLTGNLSPTKAQINELAHKYKSASKDAVKRFKEQE